jgi:hypothetical protein
VCIGKKRKAYKMVCKPEGKYQPEDVGVDWKIILKRILGK